MIFIHRIQFSDDKSDGLSSMKRIIHILPLNCFDLFEELKDISERILCTSTHSSLEHIKIYCDAVIKEFLHFVL